jgi:PAS domain S-box-containing protein
MGRNTVKTRENKGLRANPFDKLRAKAEKKLNKKIVKLREQAKGNLEEVLHELEVHQIELEMQNEELRRAQAELEASRNKYTDLYDFAPVGYFTFDKNGVVVEANLTGCGMLGVERNVLIKKPFIHFVSKESQDAFYLHRKDALTPGLQQSCEIELMRKDGDRFYAHLESTAVINEKSETTHCRTVITDITERKKVEQALAASEKRYRTMMALAPDAILVHQDGRFVYCNAAAIRLYGAENPGQLIGKHYLDIVHPDEIKIIRARVQSILDGDEQPLRECRHLRLDGREIPVETTGCAIEWMGKPATQVIIRDITERKKAEEAIRQSEDRYRSFFEDDLTGDFIADASGKIMFCNPAFVRIFGFKDENEAVGTHLADLHLNPESWDNFIKLLKQNKTIERCECENRRRDGNIIHIIANLVGTFNDKGELTGFKGYVFDDTERKKAEEAVLYERNILQAVMDGAKNMHLVYLDRDFNFVRVNEAYAKTCGYKPEEMIGKNHFALYSNAENEAIFARVRDTGVPVEFHDKPFVFPDQPQRGVTYWDWTLIPVKDKTGKVEGLVFSLFETTERKRAEENLKQLAEELKRSNKEFEEFARIAGHDLREPLRAVGGFIELLDRKYKEKWDDTARGYIAYAVNGAKRMDDLISGLHECARVQTRGKTPALIPTNAALRTAIEKLHDKIEESQAVITFDDLPPINADGNQISRVFANLIDNAIKFRSGKKPKIHVGCKKNGDAWQFAVSDNGIGIDKQFHERIFKIFQRLHSKDQYPGYGVGLTICQKIVERHGGKIWVDSEPAKGATFYFTIPQTSH